MESEGKTRKPTGTRYPDEVDSVKQHGRITDNENFEEFTKKALDEIKDYGSTRFYVGSARQSIESGTDEFASEDGVPRE